ncbi:ATP-binding protein [Streptomyces xiamenensis]|uniref:ATP-binding protein n=1 Tax=Streptomyces xiamenensis TaxID=408015 RepID=UPI0035DA1753
MSPHEMCLRLALSPYPQRVPEVRDKVRARLTAWGIADQHDVLSVVGELAANAVEHARDGGPIRVRVTLVEGAVQIAVEDGCPQLRPTPREAGEDAERGRGLALVAALSRSWGCQSWGGRKTVWASISVPGRADAVPQASPAAA